MATEEEQAELAEIKRTGNLRRFQAFVEHKADVGIDREEYDYIADFVAETGDPRYVAIASQSANSAGTHALAEAIMRTYQPSDQSRALLEAIEGFDPHDIYPEEEDVRDQARTLLGWLAEQGRWQWMEWLVRRGADPNLLYNEALRLAANGRTLSELLRLGADPGALGPDQVYNLWGEAYTWNQLRLPARVLARLYFISSGTVGVHNKIRASLMAAVGQNLTGYLWAAV